MKRTVERRLLNILAIWQILDGVFTILVYGLAKRNEFSQMTELNIAQAKAFDSLFGSVYMFITIFGMLMIGLGLLNLVIAKKYIHDYEVQKWPGVYLFVIGICSYFMMDLLGTILAVSAGIIFFAKNKSMKTINAVNNR